MNEELTVLELFQGVVFIGFIVGVCFGLAWAIKGRWW